MHKSTNTILNSETSISNRFSDAVVDIHHRAGTRVSDVGKKHSSVGKKIGDVIVAWVKRLVTS